MTRGSRRCLSDYWQDDVRGMVFVDEKFHVCFASFFVGAKWRAGIWIWVVAGRAAGGDLKADTVGGVEDDTSGPEIYFDWVNLPWLEERFF